MGLALVAVGVAGYLAWKSQQAPPQPVVQATPVPMPPPTTLATPAPPPVTAAPAPEFGEAGGKAAASVKVAQAAFESGNYDKAVASAQAALREDCGERAGEEDPDAGDGRARRRPTRSAAGDGALGRRTLRPPKPRRPRRCGSRRGRPGAVALQRRIAEAKAQAQRDAEGQARHARTAQVNAALNDAATALQAKQYEAAIAAYDRALRRRSGKCRGHARAGRPRSSAKSLAEAAAVGVRAPAADPSRASCRGAPRQEGRQRARASWASRTRPASTVKQGTQAAGPARHDRVRGDAAGAEGRRGVPRSPSSSRTRAAQPIPLARAERRPRHSTAVRKGAACRLRSPRRRRGQRGVVCQMPPGHGLEGQRRSRGRWRSFSPRSVARPTEIRSPGSRRDPSVRYGRRRA